MSIPRPIASLAPEEREALGFKPDSHLSVVGIDKDIQEPSPPIRKQPPTNWSHEQIRRQLSRERALIPVDLPRLTQSFPESTLARWALDRHVAIFSRPQLGNTAFYGNWTWLDKTTLLLDARSRPAYALWSNHEHVWLLRFLHGELTLFQGAPSQYSIQLQQSESWAGPPPDNHRLRWQEQLLLGLTHHAFLQLAECRAAPAYLPPVRTTPSGDALRSHDELLQLLSARRESTRAILRSLQRRLPGAELEQWIHDTRIAFVRFDGFASGKSFPFLSGLWRQLDERVAMLDSRVRPAYIQGQRDGLDWVLRCDRGSLELFESSEDTSGKSMSGPVEQRNGFMNHLAPEELKILRLPNDIEFEPVERTELPAELQGFSSGREPQLPRTSMDWAALLTQDEARLPVRIGHLQSILRGGTLSHWRNDGRILLLEQGVGRTTVRLAGASSLLREGLALMDARERPAYVLGSHQDLAWVLRLRQTELTLFIQVSSPEHTDWELPKPLDIPEPDIAALVGQLTVQDWLVELTKEFAKSPRPLKRVAAAGALARLWSSPDRQSRERTRKLLAAGHKDPYAAALDWFRALGRERWEFVESLAIYEWNELEKSFDDLIDMTLDDPDSAHEVGMTWLHRRDDLQSVLFLLLRADVGSAMKSGLASFDARASSHRELWRLLDIRGDERLLAVSWQEPDSWWGGLVVDEES